MSDLDGDGVFERKVTMTSFYGLEHGRPNMRDATFSGTIFQYDSASREYLPTNASFKDRLLQKIEAEEMNLITTSEPGLGQLLSVVLDYVFIGEERHAWELFEQTCTLPDKAQIRMNIQRILNGHPVYRYLRSHMLTKGQTG